MFSNPFHICTAVEGAKALQQLYMQGLRPKCTQPGVLTNGVGQMILYHYSPTGVGVYFTDLPLHTSDNDNWMLLWGRGHISQNSHRTRRTMTYGCCDGRGNIPNCFAIPYIRRGTDVELLWSTLVASPVSSFCIVSRIKGLD